MFEDGVHGLPCDVLDCLAIPHQRAARRFRGHSAKHQQVRQAADRVRPAAEAEQEDSVAVFVVIYNEFIAVRNVALDAGARHRSEQLLDEPHRRGEGGRADIGAKAGIVEDHLL